MHEQSENRSNENMSKIHIHDQNSSSFPLHNFNHQIWGAPRKSGDYNTTLRKAHFKGNPQFKTNRISKPRKTRPWNCPLILEGFCNCVFRGLSEPVESETFCTEATKSKPQREHGSTNPHPAVFQLATQGKHFWKTPSFCSKENSTKLFSNGNQDALLLHQTRWGSHAHVETRGLTPPSF